MVRGESGIALMPVFHPGVQCREGHTLSELCPRDNGWFPRSLGIANLTVATGKIAISRTTRARLYMKHGFSAILVFPRTTLSRNNSTGCTHFHTKKKT